MEQLLDQIADHLVVVIVAAVFVVGMILKSLTTMLTASGRERTRREIAAYIAEGSITAEQGERLLHADGQARRRVS